MASARSDSALHPLRVIEQGAAIAVLDQSRLPHEVVTLRLDSRDAVAEAIRTMVVRGAPLIGACAAWGLAFALRDDAGDDALAASIALLAATRPTAVNLVWALERLRARLQPLPPALRAAAAADEAQRIGEEDVVQNHRIGEHGLGLIADLHARLGRPVRILTHCNAGWLATVRWGTALAPIYLAHRGGVPVEVWVDETRPRNQGALTAWELGQEGIPHTLVVDNAGGHLMQRGLVDLAIVGADRVTAHGDVCNKIGTYLKALAARDCGVPFYAAVPSPTIDWSVADGLREIVIEERSAREVAWVAGRDRAGQAGEVCVVPEGTTCANPAFDVTPARLVTGLITEFGIVPATLGGLATLRDRCGAST